MKARTLVPWLGAAVLAMAACGAGERSDRTEAAAETPLSTAESGAPAALRAATVAAVQKQASDAYRVDGAGGRLVAINATQGLRAEFSPEGVRVTSISDPGRWTFQLGPSRWGCEGRLAEVPGATPEVRGNRVEYGREGLRTWYLNGPLGLEQGFTLGASPCREGRGNVVIALGGGDLSTEVSEQGDTVHLRDPGGSEVLHYSDLYVVDAAGRQLASALEATPGGLSIRFDDAGAVYPIEVDPLVWTEQQELTAPGGESFDRFGFAVAVEGDTAVVGGVAEKVYVFARCADTWALQQVLTAPAGTAPGELGGSVAISGTTLVVGAPAFEGSQGAAYIFVRKGAMWTLQQQLTARDGAPNDFFGQSVAIDESTVIIGAPGRVSFQGAAYVFTRSGTRWAEQQELTARDGAQDDELGWSVAIDGSTAVAGAFAHDSNLGAVYVFTRSGPTWTQRQELAPGNSQGFVQFGYSVAISGDTLIGGAPFALGQGAAFVFIRIGREWVLRQELSARDGAAGDQLGWSVALDGNTAVVGAPSRNAGQGAAYVFGCAGAAWASQQELTARDGEPGDSFGTAVAVGGETILVGAPGKDVLTGAAYVFTPAR